MENNCCYNLPPPTPYRPFIFLPPPASINPSYLPTYDVGSQDNSNSTPTWVIVGSVVAILMFCFFLYKCIKGSEKDSREAKATVAVAPPKTSKPAAATSKAMVPTQSATAKTEPGGPTKEGKPTAPSPAVQALSTGFSSCPSCGHRGGMYTFIYTCPSCDYKQETNMMYPKKK